jgi:hypothetical protein
MKATGYLSSKTAMASVLFMGLQFENRLYPNFGNTEREMGMAQISGVLRV